MAISTEQGIEQGFYSYLDLFWTFLKIGSTAFGGFMALISVVQNHLVEERKALSHSSMLDGISLATILPGPIAINVVAYVGYQIRGVAGAIISVMAAILPSFFLLLTLSYVYFSLGEMPVMNHLFMGFMPAVVAIIIATAINMGRNTLSNASDYIIALSALLTLIYIGGFFSTLLIIVLSGIVGYFLYCEKCSSQQKPATSPEITAVDTGHDEFKYKTKSKSQNKPKRKSRSRLNCMVALPVTMMSVPMLSINISMIGKLFTTFAGMSLMLFGGGFVFIPLIQEVIVETYGWLTQKEFIDAIALGQVTPGPILISATFIGFKMAGLPGAIVATIGIFTPPAILMILCTHYLEKIKSSEKIQGILKGIHCAVIGMIVAAAYVVAMTARHDLISLLIFISVLYMLIKIKIKVVWIIPMAGLTGMLFY